MLLQEPGQDRVRCLTGVRRTVTTPSPSVRQRCAPVSHHSRGGGGVWVLVSGPEAPLSPPGVKTPVLQLLNPSVHQLSVTAHNLTTFTFIPSLNDLVRNTQKYIFYSTICWSNNVDICLDSMGGIEKRF